MKLLNKSAQGASSLLAGAFVVSTFGVWARLVSPMFNTASQTVARCLLAAAIMAGVLTLGARSSQARWRGYSPPQYVAMVLLGLCTFGLALLFTVSVNSTKVGNTFSLIYVGSIVTTFIIGTAFFKEETSPLKVLAVVVALAGLSMYGSGIAALSLGIICGLGAGICDGLSNVMRKRLHDVDRNVAVTYQYAIAGVLALPLLFVGSGQVIKTVSFGAMLAMLLYAGASLLFGKLLLYGFSRFDVHVGGVLLAMQIFFGMLLGFVFFHEVPSSRELVGSSLIFMAVLAAVAGTKTATWRKRRLTDMSDAVIK